MAPFVPIGVLRADFKQKFGTPRQGALTKHSRAHLELEAKWRGRGILDGLEGFSHVWLITHLHLSANTRVRGKVHPPRLRGGKIGILASRSPHRPNNVGLTLARVERVTGDRLELSEVDVVDGTPVLDVKPYVAQADRPTEFTDGWAGALKPLAHCATEFSSAAVTQLEQLSSEPARLRALIEEMLALDPRPPAYLGREDARFAIWVADLNVVLNYRAGVFTVETVERTEPPARGPSDARNQTGSASDPAPSASTPRASNPRS